ncbi:MAG: ATP-binding protein [Alphaproteobacteria bacterium]|nr:ATP-binding protein [Alphaproteobacteria bacterium]
MQTLLSTLKEFKLSGIVSSLEERLIYAKSNNLSYKELLELLCEDEKNTRKDNGYQRRRKAAKLPTIKLLEDFDFSFQPSIDQRSISDIATCQFINSKENIILQGDSGTGKSHLAISFALKALEKEYNVFFTTVSDMLHSLHSSKVDNSYHKKIRMLANYDLLILDELGFKQLPKYSSDDLFNVISKRYEQKSTIITTNKEIDQWNDIFDDNMLTKAIVDRLMHHVTLFNIKGKSYRRKKNKK